MIRNKVMSILKQYLEEYTWGLEQDQLKMSVLKGSVKLQNLNLKSDKINERIGNSPMKLRAGILQNLEVNVSLSLTMIVFFVQYLQSCLASEGG